MTEDESSECPDCCGKGWNWEEKQVAERKSDVQMVFRIYGKFIAQDFQKPTAPRLRVVGD